MKEISKKLAYLLRHNNDGMTMTDDGYVNVEDVLLRLDISFDNLKKIVDTDKKSRYSFNDEMSMIRANQGHSLNVKLEYKVLDSTSAPEYLYHGTSVENFDKIKETGVLSKMSRTHVHLSGDIETATNVGMRHAKDKKKLVVLKIRTAELINNGNVIEMSDNGVYLTSDIPRRLLWLI